MNKLTVLSVALLALLSSLHTQANNGVANASALRGSRS